MTPVLPPVAPQIINDLPTGLQFLDRIPLASPQKAQREIDSFLDGLLLIKNPPDFHLELLEHARLPLCFIEEESARHYINKPVPLSRTEDQLLARNVATWRKVAEAYARCLRSGTMRRGDELTREREALILHRCIYYRGQAIYEHHRARRELPPGYWLELHDFFAKAEARGVETLPVPDALDALDRSSHCTAAYVGLLLTDLAGPYSLSIRNQGLVRRWSGNWSPLVLLRSACPGEDLPAFVIDLGQDCGLRPSAECLQMETLRRMDTSRLTLRLREVRQQLRQKTPPAELGLGEDCTSGQCKRLLDHLNSPWSQVRAPRRLRRRPASGLAMLCTGFDAMHYHVSNQLFNPPDKDHFRTLRDVEALHAFGETVENNHKLKSREELLGFSADAWEVVNESANGFRLIRSLDGKKMAHGQLLAICPHEGERILLAKATWLMQERGGGLIAGVEALPGIPTAVAARPLTQTATQSEAYSRAFLLPAVPVIGTEETLIVPPGWFRQRRVVEVRNGSLWRVELQRVIDDGPDFERISFIRVNGKNGA